MYFMVSYTTCQTYPLITGLSEQDVFVSEILSGIKSNLTWCPAMNLQHPSVNFAYGRLFFLLRERDLR